MFLFQLFFAQFDEKILKYNIFKIAQTTDGTQFSWGHPCKLKTSTYPAMNFPPNRYHI